MWHNCDHQQHTLCGEKMPHAATELVVIFPLKVPHKARTTNSMCPMWSGLIMTLAKAKKMVEMFEFGYF